MFAYCGNSPANSDDQTGLSWVSNILENVIARVKKRLTNVVTICNSEWRKSAKSTASKLAKRNHCLYRQVDAETDTFASNWENIDESYVLIQMHGSPSGLSGEGFHYSISDAESLSQNNNIELLIMTSCSSGGDNGSSPNMGQVLSTKINPCGFLICSTTVVNGNPSQFTSTDGGQWNVYQNGRYITSLKSNTIQMETVQIQLFFSFFQD